MSSRTSRGGHRDVLVRTYVLFPGKRVRDHLTWLKSDDPEAILDGEIDEFIRESMVLRARYRLEGGS